MVFAAQDTIEKWDVVRAAMVVAGDGIDHPRAMCTGLKFLLDSVYVVRVAITNLSFQLIEPVMMDFGVQYEDATFIKKLQNNTLTLKGTEKWITRTVVDVIASGDVAFFTFQVTYIFLSLSADNR